VLEELHYIGVKCIALRVRPITTTVPAEVWLIQHQCAGTNNVDLDKAKELGISVLSVPSYSPHSVAEFAVGLLLTTIRKYHKAFNRVREGNFTLNGILYT
jgi:D-lactate dehydrogenase